MAWYGDIYFEGQRGSDIRTLAEGIEEEQDIYLKGMGRKEEREKKRKASKVGVWNPWWDKIIAESDKKSAPKWMKKLVKMFGGDLGKIDYGDPEAISSLETPWTAGKAGDYGKELKTMQKEGDIPWWETWVGERKEEFDLALKILPFVEPLGGELPTSTTSSRLTGGEGGVDEWGNTFSFQQGGQVPSLKKYYGGGSVQGNSGPSIAEYFNKQNKTLGGSNTDSLAQRLGRI